MHSGSHKHRHMYFCSRSFIHLTSRDSSSDALANGACERAQHIGTRSRHLGAPHTSHIDGTQELRQDLL
eukprot:1343-Eustigmatos_ZCMA.PRE.1